MFAGCAKVTVVDFLFEKCSALAGLPKQLFSDMVSLKGMGSTFRDCTALIALPSGLLGGCINLTSLTLTFSGCTSLAVLPGDLLKNNTLLTSAGSTFYGCSSLINIPRRCSRPVRLLPLLAPRSRIPAWRRYRKTCSAATRW